MIYVKKTNIKKQGRRNTPKVKAAPSVGALEAARSKSNLHRQGLKKLCDAFRPLLLYHISEWCSSGKEKFNEI